MMQLRTFAVSSLSHCTEWGCGIHKAAPLCRAGCSQSSPRRTLLRSPRALLGSALGLLAMALVMASSSELTAAEGGSGVGVGWWVLNVQKHNSFVAGSGHGVQFRVHNCRCGWEWVSRATVNRKAHFLWGRQGSWWGQWPLF